MCQVNNVKASEVKKVDSAKQHSKLEIQKQEMNKKNRNTLKYEAESKVRCVNIMIEMIKKYGAEIEGE